MRHALLVCFPFALGIGAPVGAQENNAEVDTSQWQCKWCPGDEKEVESNVKAGAAYVTNDSFKFGDYTGLSEKGAYLLADADASGQNENGTYFDLQARNLGLDSRNIGIEGGKQGAARIELSYDQLPKLNEDSAQTPYSGNTVQRLPSGWVAAPNTGAMTALPGSLRDVDLSTERRQTAVGASYYQTAALSYNISYQRETKKGNRSAGLGFGSFRSAVLPIPVDYQSDIASLGVNYNARRWQVAADYQLSAFKNQNDYVRWDNAFDSPAGVTQGQAALEPDNSMQQFSVKASLQATDAVSVAASVAYGQMRQDQNYLPYTINGNVASATLPKQSLDGKIDTWDAGLNLNAEITDKVSLKFQYSQHEQDNNTSRATYDYIIADTSAAAATRENLPYGFQQKKLAAELHYLIDNQHKLAAGSDYDIYDRTYQEVETTKEAGLWGLYRARFAQVGLQVRFDYADREGDGYDATAGGVVAQNALMRKYNLADRTRNMAGFSLSYSPLNTLDLGLNAGLTQDDYSNSRIGLQESNEASLSLDMRYQPADTLTLRALYALTNVNSTQAGSSAAAAADWKAENDDRLDLFDVGMRYELMADKLGLGFDYTYAKSAGRITVANAAFPELTTKRHTFKLYSDYKLSRSSLLNVAFLYEKYDEENWAKDGVTPNSINNVLTLGEVSPYYDIGYVTLSYEYRF